MIIIPVWFISLYLINRAWGPKQTTADLAGYLFYVVAITILCTALGVL